MASQKRKLTRHRPENIVFMTICMLFLHGRKIPAWPECWQLANLPISVDSDVINHG